jgi:GNAT superfamily N-acetyltransferase
MTRLEFLLGRERLEATTAVLQRARVADPVGGVWDAADVQWWWRRPRVTDELALPVWFDDLGPAAAVGLTAWGESWQGDVHAVGSIVDVGEVWAALLEAADRHRIAVLDVPARDDDARFWALSSRAGFDKTDPHSGIAWMSAGARPAVSPSPAGFVIVDRSQRPDRPHPMVPRNGEHVERRLQECSLYDPSLDLAVEDADGSVAGYALFWCDDVTGVGMLEPLRVEDHYQRRGLARALLTTGMDRLARRGARRLKVGFESAAARNLYAGAGYRATASVCDARRRAS